MFYIYNLLSTIKMQKFTQLLIACDGQANDEKPSNSRVSIFRILDIWHIPNSLLV